MKPLWEFGAAILVVLVLVGTPVAVFAGDHYLNTAPDTYTVVAYVDESGGFVPNRITVTQGQHVHLRLTSGDVVHGFAVPDLGINVPEVYPGKFSAVDFTPATAGTYPFACTVLCSVQHARMQGAIVVLPVGGGPVMPAMPATTGASSASSSMPMIVAPAPVTNAADVAAGAKAFQARCASCHGANAAGGLKLGSATAADLRWSALSATYNGDRAAIRQAILAGRDQSGGSLDPAMPRWQGMVSDADVNAIIAYLATGPSAAGSAAGH